MANGKLPATDKRTIQAGAPNLRNRFGAAYLQTIWPPGKTIMNAGNKFIKPGFGVQMGKVNRGELDRLPDHAFFTEEEVFGEQARKLAAMGFTLEELNTPVLQPNGQPFMIGLGNFQIPAVLGDLLLGERDEPFDNEVAGNVRQAAARMKQAGTPFVKFVADKFGGRKDTIIGVDAQGQGEVINVQTQGTESTSKLLRRIIPAVAAAGIVSLGTFGPGGLFNPAVASPTAAGTGATAGTTAAAVPAGSAAGGGVIPTAAGAGAAGAGGAAAAGAAAAGAAGGAGGGLLPSLLPSLIPAAATVAGGWIAADVARGAGETAADAQQQAANTTLQVQREIADRALQEQLRQEQRAEPFRQAALRALPDLEAAARAQPTQFQIDPNLLANLPDIPQFSGPDLTQINEAIAELRQAPSFELSPQGQAAIDIGTRLAQRNAAAGGFGRSGNLLAELQQLGTEQANLDFARQEQLRQGRLAASIDSLAELARLEAGTEQDRINASLLQRELERQSRLDPVTLQQMNREMQRQDQADLFGRLGSLSGLAPGTPQVVSSTIPTLGAIGRDIGRFQSAVGQAQAAGELGAANTLFNTINNLGTQLGQNLQQQNLLNQLRTLPNFGGNQRTQAPVDLGPPPVFQPVTPQLPNRGFGGFAPIPTGEDYIGAQSQAVIPNRMLI